jgi:hypothetical protein
LSLFESGPCHKILLTCGVSPIRDKVVDNQERLVIGQVVEQWIPFAKVHNRHGITDLALLKEGVLFCTTPVGIRS